MLGSYVLDRFVCVVFVIRFVLYCVCIFSSVCRWQDLFVDRTISMSGSVPVCALIWICSPFICFQNFSTVGLCRCLDLFFEMHGECIQSIPWLYSGDVLTKDLKVVFCQMLLHFIRKPFDRDIISTYYYRAT